jgi:hypothetical protein
MNTDNTASQYTGWCKLSKFSAKQKKSVFIHPTRGIRVPKNQFQKCVHTIGSNQDKPSLSAVFYKDKNFYAVGACR